MTNTQTIKVSGTLNSPFSALDDYVVYSGGDIIDPMTSPLSFYYTSSAISFTNGNILQFSGKFKSVFDKEINSQSVFFKNNGELMYVMGNVSDKVHQYFLSKPWDVNTATYQTFLNLDQSIESKPTGLFFKPDGTRMYVVGEEYNDIVQYNLTSPWNVQTAIYNSNFPVVFENATKGLYISPDGLNLYVTGISSKKIHQYGLTTPWEISTGTYSLKEFFVGNEESQPSDLFFKPDGTEVYIAGLEKGKIFEYKLSTPWDINTTNYTNISFSLSSQDKQPVGLYFKDDGKIFYILGTENDAVYQYNIPQTQIWNLSATELEFLILSGGLFKKNYNDLINLKQSNIGNFVFCDTEIVFDFSNFDETKSKIIKLIFNPNNGENTQTFSTQLSNFVIVYPKLSVIKTNYYPSELYNTVYYPNFQIFYEDGNYINLTIPLTVFQCGIYEIYKEKTILDTLPYYASSNNVLLFINDDNTNELFLGDIDTKLPFILSANVPSKDVELPFLLELIPQESTIESIDPFIPTPPIIQNPISLDAGSYSYIADRGLSLDPTYTQFNIGNEFDNQSAYGLTISQGGAPYFAGTGINIELIQLD